MWVKYLITIILFYFFALLQSSFFAHFNFFGAFPNFVFILFFLLIFFDKETNYYKIFFYSAIAGILLDFFSYAYFGISVVLLFCIGILLKKIQSALLQRQDKYPVIYFLPLFLISFIFYEAFFTTNIGFESVAEIIYNLIFAWIGFYVFRYFLTNKHV